MCEGGPCMKGVVTGLMIGMCLMVVPRAHASTIGVTTGAKYACSVENCGTDASRAATPFVAVQQLTLARASAGEYSVPAGASAGAGSGAVIAPVDTLASPVGQGAPHPQPAALSLLRTGLAGLVIRPRAD